MVRRKNYMFTNRKHSEKAIMGSVLGLISLVSIGIVVFLSYRQAGDAPASYGLTGLLAVIFSLIGLVLGITSARDKNNYPFFPWMGIVINGLALICMGFLVFLGA